ncbi:hypothetical protein LJC71_06330 [Desulfosarcina sp. OttesenSCG-928-A07]|nr:hypothetical protein [Desulfosarcina sp. OttesenSCG-928-G17]MDL2329347.1 hypothetical protein [Desulfosarcina sp. OttesenSCG-928-A07]
MKTVLYVCFFVLAWAAASLFPDDAAARKTDSASVFPGALSPADESHSPGSEKTEKKESDDPSPGFGETRMRIMDEIVFAPVDEDGDGLFDALIVRVDVEILYAGFYSITGVLRKNGEIVADKPVFDGPAVPDGGAADPYGPGIHTLSICFSGDQILRSGENGPYDLEITAFDPALAGQKTVVTPVYDHLSFGEFGGLASLSGITDTPVDTDDNGRYDGLSVAIETNVILPAEYQIHGSLYDSHNKAIGQTVATHPLDSGEQTVMLQFPGQPILRSGQDGPYEVAVSLATAKNRGMDGMKALTRAYTHLDFEGILDLDGVMIDQGIDTNGNGFYDVLRVSFGADIRAAGTFRIAGYMKMKWKTRRFGVHAMPLTLTLEPGHQTLILDFPGQFIKQYSIDGPYEIEVSFWDPADNRQVDKVTLNPTKPYSHNAFDPSGFRTPLESAARMSGKTGTQAALTGVFAEHLADSDDDGLYGHLAIDVEVNVQFPGTYCLYGNLCDFRGRMVCEELASLDLDAGVQVVTLAFSGAKIRRHGASGPYQLESLMLLGSGFEEIKEDAYQTLAYPYLQFSE